MTSIELTIVLVVVNLALFAARLVTRRRLRRSHITHDSVVDATRQSYRQGFEGTAGRWPRD